MSARIRVHVLECGRVVLPRCALFREKGELYPFAMLTFLRSKDKLINVPAFCFLIEHPNGKRIVYDTAWSTEVRTHPWRNMAASHLVDQPILPPGQSISERIWEYGYMPENIDYVILSHMHIDHAGGVNDMRRAAKILVSKEEWKVAGNGGIASYRKRCWDKARVESFEYDRIDGLGPINRGVDFFGDGTVMLIATPGHTPGHTSILIRNNGKQLLLAGDNGYARKSWKQGVLPGLMKDADNMTRSLAWAKEFYDNADGLIDIISDHETELDCFEYEL